MRWHPFVLTLFLASPAGATEWHLPDGCPRPETLETRVKSLVPTGEQMPDAIVSIREQGDRYVADIRIFEPAPGTRLNLFFLRILMPGGLA